MGYVTWEALVRLLPVILTFLSYPDHHNNKKKITANDSTRYGYLFNRKAKGATVAVLLRYHDTRFCPGCQGLFCFFENHFRKSVPPALGGADFLWQKSGNGCSFRRKGERHRRLHPGKHFRHGRLVRRHCFNQIGILLNFIGAQIVQTLRPVLRLRDPVQCRLSERHLARIRTDKPSPLRIVS